MTEQTTEAPVTPDAPQETPREGTEDQGKTFDADYVDKLRKEAAKYRTEAKANAEAAKELATIRESQKSDAEKAAERLATAEKRAAEAEAKALRREIALENKLDRDDAELLDALTDEDAMRRLAERLAKASADTKPETPTVDLDLGARPGLIGSADPKTADLAQIEADLKAAKRR